MKRTFLLLASLFSLTLHAQLDHKVTTGVVAYNSGDYGQAVQALSSALEDITQLKEKNIPKAYYYRALSNKRKYYEAGQENDTEWLENNPNVWISIFRDLQGAQDHDDGNWNDKTMAEFADAYHPLLQIGLNLLNNFYQTNEASALPLAIEHLRYAGFIQPSDYMPKDLLAQAQLAAKDSLNASVGFDRAILSFKENPPNKPDLLIAYAYYRFALLERYYFRSVNRALEKINEGQEMLDKEWARVIAQELEEDLQVQYDNAKADLLAFELDCYLNAPHKRREAMPRFATAIANNPKDYNMHVAYASLLEQSDIDSAISVYRVATNIDPNRHLAWFNLGAVYNNIAKEWYDKANEEEDYAEAERLMQKGDDMFRLAMPCFEKALEIDPADQSTYGALKQIYIALDLTEKYNALVGD